MTDTGTLAEVLAAHGALGYDDCDGCECGADVRTHEAHRQHVAEALAARIVQARAGEGALREAAAWVAEGIGYPVECALPSHPMPQALWDALVDHVHADEMGRWHGNTLDRDDTESWLADEAGRAALTTADPS